MIGHTKATAGVAGLIKVSLALHHRVLPATLGVGNPNPKADFGTSPFYVNTETRPWIQGIEPHPRRAGVSAFGFGGTNFHIVLEEYTGAFLPPNEPALEQWPAELFLWRGGLELRTSSKRSTTLRGRARPRDAALACADLAYSLALEASAAAPGATSLAIVAESLTDLERKLASCERADRIRRRAQALSGRASTSRSGRCPADGKIAFLFPGQGSQFVNMARELAVAFPEARECFERVTAYSPTDWTGR